ncbi:hypothetical protein THALO_330005 [Tenacibaculum halocynthiae]
MLVFLHNSPNTKDIIGLAKHNGSVENFTLATINTENKPF